MIYHNDEFAPDLVGFSGIFHPQTTLIAASLKWILQTPGGTSSSKSCRGNPTCESGPAEPIDKKHVSVKQAQREVDERERMRSPRVIKEPLVLHKFVVIIYTHSELSVPKDHHHHIITWH